jgi:hypothetical protein
MKKEKELKGQRRITISYLKDPLEIHKEVRERANYYMKRGVKKQNAHAKANSEVQRIKSTQILYVENSLEVDPISDLVADIAGPIRNYKFVSELIR